MGMTEQERLEEAAELACSLIAIPSVNPAVGAPSEVSGEEALAVFVAAWATRRGLAAELFPALPGRPCVLVTVPAGVADAPTVGYFAHLDTVWTPAMPTPFNPRRERGRILGLGACDDKGSLAAGLLAAAALAQGPPPPVNLVVVGTVDEEFGFAGIRALVPGKIRPDVAIVAEATGLCPVIAHKGIVRWRVATRGESVHASLVPRGRSAIFPAARLVAATERLQGELLSRPPHPRLGLPTLNVGIIRGGSQENSVPDHCEFTVERRLLPGESPEAALAELRAALDPVGEAYTLHGGFQAPPFAIDEGHPWPVALRREIRKLRPDLGFGALTVATEAAHLAGQGIPTVVFGPGDITHAHAATEAVDVAEILAAGDVVISAIRGYTT
jgi:acetylornithine deacetylase